MILFWRDRFLRYPCSFYLIHINNFISHCIRKQNSRRRRKFERKLNIYYLLLGFQKIPKSLSLRLIVLSSLLMSILISCGFSSTLTSCLANKGNFVSLTNLEDIAMKRTHSLCIRNDSTAYAYFTVVKIETKKMYKYNINCCICSFS